MKKKTKTKRPDAVKLILETEHESFLEFVLVFVRLRGSSHSTSMVIVLINCT